MRWKYHFTINDAKPDLFAQDLIFFLLLDELAPEIVDSGGERIEVTEKV